MTFFYYIFTMFSKMNEKNGDYNRVNGALGVVIFLGPILSTFLNIFDAHVINMEDTLAACCSFGPINPKNPFSSKAVTYTLVVVPILLFVGAILLRKSNHILDIMKRGYRLPDANWHLLIAAFIFMMSAPIGARGIGLTPWLVLGFYFAIFMAFSIYIRNLKLKN